MYGVRCTTVLIPLPFFNRKPYFMYAEEMNLRTKQFAINIAFLTQKLLDNLINKT